MYECMYVCMSYNGRAWVRGTGQRGTTTPSRIIVEPGYEVCLNKITVNEKIVKPYFKSTCLSPVVVFEVICLGVNPSIWAISFSETSALFFK